LIDEKARARGYKVKSEVSVCGNSKATILGNHAVAEGVSDEMYGEVLGSYYRALATNSVGAAAVLNLEGTIDDMMNMVQHIRRCGKRWRCVLRACGDCR